MTKCFRCFEFSHQARFCKAEVDRSNVCRKCGVIEHFARDCKSEPNCVLCNSKGAVRLNHAAGSYMMTDLSNKAAVGL